MSLPIQTPINNPKNNHPNFNEKKFKGRGAPINVKMCQIPNNIGFHNKVKTNIISSSYFNLNIKNNANLLEAKEKNKNNKNDINKLSKDIKTNYYSLIIPNNIKSNNNSNNITNNIFNNYSKLSINSLITNSINKSKKMVNSRKQNLINEEYSVINKHNNYSFKIKVNKIKDQLISENSRNNSIKNIYYSNDNKSNINIKFSNKENDIMITNNIINEPKLKKASRNKKNMSTIINKIIYPEKKDKEKSFSVKSVFKKIDLNSKYHSHKNTLFISYSEKEKNKEKIKRKIINSSHLILNNNNKISSFKQMNICNKIKDKNKLRIHTRNNTTSYNGKNINDIFCGKKIVDNNVYIKNDYSSSIIKKNCNQTHILNNVILDNFKLKKKLVISPKTKYGTNIINNNKDFSHLINYNSISDNINNLKNIIYKNNYNSNDNIKNHKKLLKEIPAPKVNNNSKQFFARNENNNNLNYIKEITIKKISKKKIKGTRNSVKIKKNKTTIKLNEEKYSINLKKDNYDRDDIENENINIIKDKVKVKDRNKENYKNKISIVDILKKNNNQKNENKVFISKKIKSIRIEKKKF